MKKRKCNWCYFDDGSKKKITSLHKFKDCIIFCIKDECYMFKEVPFYSDYDLEVNIFDKFMLPRIVHSYFYKFRFKYSPEIPISHSDTQNEDYWIVAPIDRIEVLV